MTQKVKGYLAEDGKFFDTEAESERHEYRKQIVEMCESHNVNPDNFLTLLREWQVAIIGYYNADSKCKDKDNTPTGEIHFAADGEFPEDYISSDDVDHPDFTVRDKDAPGFLEQQIGRRK